MRGTRIGEAANPGPTIPVIPDTGVRAARRAARHNQPLQEVTQATADRYHRCCVQFFGWAHDSGKVIPSDFFELDCLLREFVQVCWEEGEGYSLPSYVKCGLQHKIWPLRGQLVGSSRLLAAWSRQELPARAPPIPLCIVQAMAGLAQYWGLFDVSLCLLTQFHCYLRTAEITGLRAGQLSFSADGHALITLPETKGTKRSGAIESVTIEDAGLAFALKVFTAQLAPGGSLLRRSVPQFRKMFNSLLDAIGLDTSFKPYSLRRGGATAHFLECNSLDLVVVRGRWAQAKTARIYINLGLLDFQQSSYGPKTQEKISSFSALLRLPSP